MKVPSKPRGSEMRWTTSQSNTVSKSNDTTTTGVELIKLRPCADRRLYNLRRSAVGEFEPSNTSKNNLSTVFHRLPPSSNVVNLRSAPHLRGEPHFRPSATTSPFRNISYNPDHRRRGYRSHHRLGPPRSRLSCHSACLTLGILHRRTTPHISNRRCSMGISPSSLRSTHRRNLSQQFEALVYGRLQHLGRDCLGP